MSCHLAQRFLELSPCMPPISSGEAFFPSVDMRLPPRATYIASLLMGGLCEVWGVKTQQN